MPIKLLYSGRDLHHSLNHRRPLEAVPNYTALVPRVLCCSVEEFLSGVRKLLGWNAFARPGNFSLMLMTRKDKHLSHIYTTRCIRCIFMYICKSFVTV